MEFFEFFSSSFFVDFSDKTHFFPRECIITVGFIINVKRLSAPLFQLNFLNLKTRRRD